MNVKKKKKKSIPNETGGCKKFLMWINLIEKINTMDKVYSC